MSEQPTPAPLQEHLLFVLSVALAPTPLSVESRRSNEMKQVGDLPPGMSGLMLRSRRQGT